ncbi:MAG: hypothetical protein ACREN2_02700 [Candidatus Dormibacteria bacterium]
MDALGAAQAVLALALIPGGALLAASGWAAAAAAGRRGTWSLEARELFALLLLDVAVAQAPLPGSPIGTLPPGQGAAPNLAVAALLLAGALVAAMPPTRRRLPLMLAAILVAAALAVGFGAASLSLPAIMGHPGAAMLAARAGLAAAVLLAGPVLTSGSRLSAAGEATLLAGLALLVLSLLAPPGLPAWQAALAAAAVVTVAVAYAAGVLRWRAQLAQIDAGTGVACVLAGAATLAAVTISTLI